MRRGAFASAGVAVAAVLVACSSTAPRPAPGPTLGWTAGAAEAANGTVPSFDATSACGSSTDTWLLELLHHPPTDLKVLEEWGDVVPGGRQILVSGTVATSHLGPGDFPMDHPLGDDLSMDVELDPPFQTFSRKLGSAQSDTQPGQLHVEISAGFIPHLPRTSSTTPGQTWRQLSDFNLTGFQPGFDTPALGDRVLVGGRFIVDCGHPDFHTELHPIDFLAWAHTQGNDTVVRVYANAYWDTQIFNPDLTAGGRVNDTARLSAPPSKAFPPFLVDEVARLITGKTDRLRTYELLGAVRPAPVSWQVCPPAGASGRHVQLTYDLRVRPGVTARVDKPGSNGCTTLQVTVGSDFRAPDVDVRSCAMPWDYLSALAQQAIGGPLDARALIKANVPRQYWSLVDRDPESTCADGLSGPAVNVSPTGRNVQTDPSQPFPVYGVVVLASR